jgi:hypothetical protein
MQIRVKNLKAAQVLLRRGWIVVGKNADGVALERDVPASVILDTAADFLFRPSQYAKRPKKGGVPAKLVEDEVYSDEAAQ